jgi:hypothetical protein
MVSQDEDGYRGSEYSKLTAVLVEAIKEQQEQIEALSLRIAEFEKPSIDLKVVKRLMAKSIEDMRCKLGVQEKQEEDPNPNSACPDSRNYDVKYLGVSCSLLLLVAWAALAAIPVRAQGTCETLSMICGETVTCTLEETDCDFGDETFFDL